MREDAKSAMGDFITAKGEMARLLRSCDWTATSLGRIDQWPSHLRATVNLCLNSPFPMMISWGKELVMIYNDAYREIIGQKHPSAFGAPAASAWAEIWDFIKPHFDHVMHEGQACWFENQLILLNRNNYTEESYFTFSYNPLFNDFGHVDGVLTIATETSDTVIKDRHLSTLAELARNITGLYSVHDVYKATLVSLEDNLQDFPFTALYEVHDSGTYATLFGTSGITLPHPSIPGRIDFSDDEKTGSRNFRKCVSENCPVQVFDIRARLGDMPSGDWSVSPEEGVLLPLSYAGKKHPFAVMVIGINPHMRLNGKLMDFFQLISSQVGTEISKLITIEEQEQVIRKTLENDRRIQNFIDQLLESRQKTEESEDRLRMAVAATGLGTWDYHPLTGHLTWSDECRKIYDCPNDIEVDMEAFNAHIHPDDRKFVTDEIARSMDPQGNGNYDISYRILRFSDQATRWIKTQGKVYFNDDKQPVRFIGTVIDITDQKHAQEDLMRSERLFRSIVQNIPNSLLIVIDPDKRFLVLEGDISERLGFNSQDYKGRHLSELISPELYERSVLYYDRMLKGEKFSVEEKNAAGEDYLMHFVPMRDEHANVYSGLIIALDVTDSRKAEEKSAKLAALVRTSNDAIISKTLDGIITSWNEAAERMYGYSASEIIGQSILTLIPPERADEEPKIIEELKRSGVINHFETQRITKDKRLIDISITVSLIKDSEGNIIGTSKIARDISEKKRAERLLIESEERIRLAAESADLGTWDLDLTNGRIVSNTIEHRIPEFSDSGSKLNRKEFISIVHEEDRLFVQTAFKDAIVSGKLSFEARLLKKDGTILWVRVKGKTIYNEDRKPVRLLGIIMDITEQKNFLIELEESEKRFKTVADTAPVMIWTAQPDKQCDFFNKAWLEFTGRPMEMELGNGWAASIHPEDLDKCTGIYNASFDQRVRFIKEYRLRRHDGQYRWVACQGIPRYTSDGLFVGYIGSCLDIHESKLAKEELENIVQSRTSELNNRNFELQQQKDFVETMLDASIDVMLVYDQEMRFKALNKACEIKYGLKKEDVIGRRLLDVYPYAAGSQGYHDLERALKGETVHNPVYYSNTTNLYYEDFLIPLKTQNNEVHSVLVIMHDITKNIQDAEQLKKTNAELIKSNRDLEQFAYIASHDLQEPLRKIQTFTNLLESHFNDEAARKKYFDKISSSAHRMSELIRAVLNYSRLTITSEHFEDIDLNAIIEQVKIDFELMIADKHAIVTHDHLPYLQGIPLQISQLFSNLVSNSLKFSKEIPLIHIASRICLGSEILKYLPAAEPGREYAEIIFRDNGIGFEQKYVDQVFTIFQRLNDRTQYEGTGIGLALCKKIVDNHHGYIFARSEPGIGSEFIVYLPLKPRE